MASKAAGAWLTWCALEGVCVEARMCERWAQHGWMSELGEEPRREIARGENEVRAIMVVLSIV